MPIYHLIFDTAQDIHDAAQTLHPTDVSLRQAFVDENLQARHRPIVENLKNYLEATHLSVYANKISVEIGGIILDIDTNQTQINDICANIEGLDKGYEKLPAQSPKPALSAAFIIF